MDRRPEPESNDLSRPTPTRRSVVRSAASGVAAAAAMGLASGGAFAAEDTPAAKNSPADKDGPVVRHGRIRQSVCQWCFGKMSLDELCAASKAMGLVGIDLLNPAQWPTLKKYDLIATMTNSHGIDPGLAHKENHEPCLAAIRKAVEANAEAGFPNVICFSGNRKGMDDEEGLKNCAEALKQVVGLAEQKKVTICMELLNSKVDHGDYMCDRTPWGVKLVKAVGSERFKLLYDIYHMQIMEGDVIRTIKDNHAYIGHYHTAGVPGRHEIDESQELFYPAVMRAIADTGYKGFVAQEFLPSREPIASLRQAAGICDV